VKVCMLLIGATLVASCATPPPCLEVSPPSAVVDGEREPASFGAVSTFAPPFERTCLEVSRASGEWLCEERETLLHCERWSSELSHRNELGGHSWPKLIHQTSWTCRLPHSAAALALMAPDRDRPLEQKLADAPLVQRAAPLIWHFRQPLSSTSSPAAP
jgi:hypothetical protein